MPLCLSLALGITSSDNLVTRAGVYGSSLPEKGKEKIFSDCWLPRNKITNHGEASAEGGADGGDRIVPLVHR